MRANAISTSRMNDTLTNFRRHYIQNNHVSKRDLIHELQHLPIGPRYGSKTVAADQIEKIITLGHFEIKDDMCFWNHTPTPRILPGGQPDPTTSRAPRGTKKNPWGHM